MVRRLSFGRGTWLRVATAALLLFTYALLALPAAVHHHAGDRGTPIVAGKVAAAIDHHTQQHPSASLSATDCALCDFAASLLAPAAAIAPPAVTPHLVEAPAPVMPLRARPYLPFRFCDRSSSRAPPALLAA